MSTQHTRLAQASPSMAALVDFRARFFRCLTGWADATFELCDAALCAPAPICSVPTLSLEPAFRRSHGSLYKALARGQVDAEAMRDLLAGHRPPDWPLVFAVDAIDLGPLRRRDQPRAGLLLLCVQALGREADRGRLVLLLDHWSGLGERLLDRADGRPPDPTQGGCRRRHRLPGARPRRQARRHRVAAAVLLRRRLRPDRAHRHPERGGRRHRGPDPR